MKFAHCAEVVGIELAVVMEAVTEDTGAAVLARSAWWRAARSQFLSFSAGPRWRGQCDMKVTVQGNFGGIRGTHKYLGTYE